MNPASRVPPPRRSPRRTLLRLASVGLAAVTVLSSAALAGQASAAKGKLELGILDETLESNDSQTRTLAFDRTAAGGANIAVLYADWRGIAQSTPENPTDPSDPAYAWGQLDRAVVDATARGLRAMVVLYRAPDYAEGAHPPANVSEGTWRPSPAKLGEFATATATRYSGSFPNPATPGTSLPRVALWQVWAEPNIPRGLWPQSERRKGEWRHASPTRYRRMLDAAYKAIKGVSRSNTVITAGTAPFGDYVRRAKRIPPLRFWREVFCVRGKKLHKARCPGPRPRFDVLAHNTLPAQREPWADAMEIGGGPDDLTVPDMKKLQRLLRKARARKAIRSPRRTPLWATELLWVSDPPTRGGVSPGLQADYLADALYLLWRQRVSTVIWVKIVDPARGSTDFASGLHFNDWTAKPAFTAFRFPFVALRERGKLKVWGKAPAPGTVEIQRQDGGGWTTVTSLSTGASNIFTGNLPPGGGTFRAVSGAEASLSRSVG